MDYEEINTNLVFNADNPRQCITVNITDDDAAEFDEFCFVVIALNESLVNVQLTNEFTDIVITDNDGECSYYPCIP